MTYKEIILKTINEGYIGLDNTCKGECSKCGECCGIILPIDQEDADRIVDYVIKNNIFPQRQKLIMEHKLQCPYYSGSKNGCKIYPARPKICQIYQCNKLPNINDTKKLIDAIPVDMWGFAEDIERKMKNGNNKKTRKTTNQSI